MNIRPGPLIGNRVTGLMPSTRGPRDGARNAAPEVTHVVPLHQPLTVRHAIPVSADADILPPVPVVKVTSRPGQIIAPATRSQPTKPSKGIRPMPRPSTTDHILAALKKHNPQPADALMRHAGLDNVQFHNACYNLKKKEQIVMHGTGDTRQYGLPGTKFAATAKPDKPTQRTKKPARSKPAPRAEPAGPFALALANANGHATTATPATYPPDTPRAIETADGQVIVLQGSFFITELSNAQARAVQSLELRR